MNNLNAAIGIGQIKKFKKIKQKKGMISKKYETLVDKDLAKPLPKPWYSKHLTWINCLILTNPLEVKKIINLLKRSNIETKYFWKPMHLQKIKDNFIIEKNMKNTNYVWKRILPLPSSTGLKNNDQNKIINIIKKYFKNLK
mgnify:FL=1